MTEPFERLREVRRKAGYETAADAANAFGWEVSAYRSHENGYRGIKPEIAEKYAKGYRVSPEWILYGKGKAARPEERKPKAVPLVGYVSAGATAYFTPQGELGEVDAPDNATESTVGVEIRGDSLGSFFDRWLVFYDDVRRPLTPDLIGRLCVIGLEDGRVLIKKPQRSRVKGLYHLLSQTEEPILDVAVEWAAKVKSMVPR